MSYAEGFETEGAEQTGDSDREVLSTTRLLERLADGDESAVDALYRRYLGPLQAWARGRLPHWARDLLETDDLVQETMLKTLRNIAAFEPERTGAFQAYLRRGVRNGIRDEIRRVRRRPLREGTVGNAADDSPSPIEEAIGAETLERYEEALGTLSATDQAAIVARIELGLPYSEVAQSIDKPSASAARMTVNRAIVRLAEELARAG